MFFISSYWILFGLMASSSSSNQSLPVQSQPHVLTSGSWSVIGDDEHTFISQADLHLSSQWVSLVHDINSSLNCKPIELPWDKKRFFENTGFLQAQYRLQLPNIVPPSFAVSSQHVVSVVEPPAHAWQSVARRLNSV